MNLNVLTRLSFIAVVMIMCFALAQTTISGYSGGGQTTSADLISDRVVHVYGPVNFEMTERILQQLRQLDARSDKEIIVRIVSPGGSVYAGLMIVDGMQNLRSPVRTVCEGVCASMGAVILAAGDPGKRVSMPNAMILIHSVSGGAQGTVDDIALQLEEIVRLQNLLLDILSASKPAMKETIRGLLKTDTILTPKQAVELGIIDEIL